MIEGVIEIIEVKKVIEIIIERKEKIIKGIKERKGKIKIGKIERKGKEGRIGRMWEKVKEDKEEVEIKGKE